MLSTLGWIGNIALVWGIWEIGNRRRVAHLITCVGESCWIVKSIATGQYDLAAICAVFFALAARCWFKWAPEVTADAAV